MGRYYSAAESAEVFRLQSEGVPRREIASRLGRSEMSVKQHLKRPVRQVDTITAICERACQDKPRTALELSDVASRELGRDVPTQNIHAIVSASPRMCRRRGKIHFVPVA